MKIQSITLENWRNLTAAQIAFQPGVNVLFGRNAQGKSNILEGIYYFARGRSFRGARDRELIAFDAPACCLRLTCLRDGFAHPTELEVRLPAAGKKRYFRNGAPLASAFEMMGMFRAVLFCPSHLQIVTGGPLERRTFLDIALSQLSGAYLTHLRRYARYLADRNALIKRARDGGAVAAAEWAVYDEGLSRHGAQIAAYRAEYTSYLASRAAAAIREMTDGAETAQIQYRSHALPARGETAEGAGEAETLSLPRPLTGEAEMGTAVYDRLYRRLTENREREIAAGATLYGIHKDDVQLSLNGRETRLYGSQGQQRSMVLALKLAEGDIAGEIGGEMPVFLLDDVFSELDAARRAYLMEKLTGRQIVVTSCEPAVVPGAANAAFHEISGGTVL